MKKFKKNHIRNLKSRLRNERTEGRKLIQKKVLEEEKYYDELVYRVEKVCGKHSVATPATTMMLERNSETVYLPRPVNLGKLDSMDNTVMSTARQLHRIDISALRLHEVRDMLHLRVRYQNGQSAITVSPQVLNDEAAMRSILPDIAEELMISLHLFLKTEKGKGYGTFEYGT